MQRITLALACSTLALMIAAPSQAQLNSCASAKKKCVAKKVKALLKCHTLAEQTGVNPTTDPTIQACLAKARSKFDGGATPGKGCFGKLEAKHPGACLTYDDTTALESTIDTFVNDVVTQVDPSYPAALQNLCSAGKKKCVAKKTAALLKCHVKKEKPPGIPPETFAACVQRARDKFDGGPMPGCIATLEAKYPGNCPTTGDAGVLESKVDTFVSDAVCQLDFYTCPQPTVTPFPIPTCAGTPGPLPTPNPNHACCVAGPYCADLPPGNAGDCFGGPVVIPGGFCICGGGCYVPQ
ncbi:MAG TPA: hypothetical protein VGK30_07130 [Candidatus Binatia bacterium]